MTGTPSPASSILPPRIFAPLPQPKYNLSKTALRLSRRESERSVLIKFHVPNLPSSLLAPERPYRLMLVSDGRHERVATSEYTWTGENLVRTHFPINDLNTEGARKDWWLTVGSSHAICCISQFSVFTGYYIYDIYSDLAQTYSDRLLNHKKELLVQLLASYSLELVYRISKSLIEL